MSTSPIVTLMRPVVLSDWALVPGPEQMEEPTNSQFVHDITPHSAASIAVSLLAFPGMDLVHSAEPSWDQWKARWQDSDKFIELDVTLFDDLEETWGGSGVEADCLAKDIIKLWSFLKTRHSGVWLHAPDCIMHTQESWLRDLVAQEAEQS